MTHSAAVQAKPGEAASARPLPLLADAAPMIPSVSPEVPQVVKPSPRILFVEAALSSTVAPVAAAGGVLEDAAPSPVAPMQFALANAGPAQAVSPLVVSPAVKPQPDLRIDMQASEDDVSQNVSIWPREAYQTRLDGRVTLGCKIDRYGLAERCDVVSEAPVGKGFGKAALEMRPTFKLAPTMGPEGPVDAIKIIAINFKAPDTQIDLSLGTLSGGLHPDKEARMIQVGVAGNPLPMRPVTMLDHPVWIAAASFDDLARVYPAKGGGIEGYAVAHCHVERNGGLGGCFIIKQMPENSGFAQAALKLAPNFRVDPKLVASFFRTKVWVDVPIRFPPPAAQDRTVTAPIWVAGVDASKPPHVFPPAAAEKGLTSGHGVARCTVGADGALIGCVADPDEPDSFGFSAAAAHLASRMRMSLWSADAAPVAGAVVHVPIRLNLRGSAG
jgi:TonB family protein